MRVTNNPNISADTQNSANSAQSAKRTGKASSEQSSKANDRASSAPIEGDSRPEISSKARELATAKAAASAAPDVREAKIAELKERIAAGKYNVDAKAVADRMVDDHLSSGIG
jgi:negative regulator of flagellin synthesis FlgM